MMLAEAASATESGPLANFRMTDHDRYELKIAGLLHDCGKITTPVHVVDKATKLQTIFDRIHLVDTRFEVLKRDAEIEALKHKIALMSSSSRTRGSSDAKETLIKSPVRPELVEGHKPEALNIGVLIGVWFDRLTTNGLNECFPKEVKQIDADLIQQLAKLDEERDFLRNANTGVESMPLKDQERVHEIGTQYHWRGPSGAIVNFLTPDEIENLAIRSGTLTAAERDTINHHIVATIKMLEQLPWPNHLKHVTEYAGGHHERMDGKGYPKGLTRDQMSVQARAMGIADIFEALTARDRPYKHGMKLSQAVSILAKFAKNGHIDPDLFEVFIRNRLYLKYAETFLEPAQIDAVDTAAILANVAQGS
jgi:hypothetical protein